MHKSVRHGEGALQYTILPQESEEGDWSAAGGSPKKKCPPRTIITVVLFLFVFIGIVMAVIVPMYLNGSESENGNVGPAPFGDLGQAEGGNQNTQGNVMVMPSPSPHTKLATTISYEESGTENRKLEGKTPTPSKDNHFRVENKEKVTTLPPEQKTATEKYDGTKNKTSTETTTQVTPKTTSSTVIKLDTVSTTEHGRVTIVTQTPSTSTQESKSDLQDLFKEDSETKKEDKQKVGTAEQKKLNKTVEESTTEANTPTTETNGKGSGSEEPSTRDEVNMENFTRSPLKGHDSDKVKVTETNEEKKESDYVTSANEEGGFFSSVQVGMKTFDYQDYIAIGVVGSFTILLLIITGICFSLHRRKKRSRRRKAVGKMVTDLQSGDNVMLLTGSSEEE